MVADRCIDPTGGPRLVLEEAGIDSAAGLVAGLLTLALVGLAVVGLGWQLLGHGVYHHAVGGWGAPLGIDLHADGLSLLMLAMTAQTTRSLCMSLKMPICLSLRTLTTEMWQVIGMLTLLLPGLQI